MRKSILVLALSGLLSGCLAHQADRGAKDTEEPRQAWFVGAEGAAVGQVFFTEAPRGVLIRMEFAANALSPGWHGVHLHGVGDCSDRASGFQASGAHIGHGPEYVQHGFLNPWENERGDLPNVFISPGAPSGAEFYLPDATLALDFDDDERFSLLDGDGSALLIHANPDDHQTQPIGNAGARVACAALTRLP